MDNKTDHNSVFFFCYIIVNYLSFFETVNLQKNTFLSHDVVSGLIGPNTNQFGGSFDNIVYESN